MGLKGIAFTTDVLIGLGLVVALFSLMPLRIETNYPEMSFEALGYQSNDVINILATMKADSFSNTKTISDLLSSGNMTPEDLNKTLLDLIGSFWYSGNGNKTIASSIAKDVLENLTRKCLSLQTQNETIYSSCNYTSDNVAVAYRIASGYEVGKPVFGYIARAWATKVLKNTTQIIPFYPEGSGWRPSQSLNVKKTFYLSNITIYNATLYISLHFGTDKQNVESGAGIVKFEINGNERKNNVRWLYLQQENRGGGEVTTAAYGVLDVTNDLLRNSQNTIEFRIQTPFYHSHVHPGMRLILTHSLTQDMLTTNTSFTKRFYFDDVTGQTGAWSMVSFYIPENAKDVSGKLHLNMRRVDDTKVGTKNTTDIEIYINSNTSFYKDGVTEGWPFSSCAGGRAAGWCNSCSQTYHCDRTVVSTKDVLLDFDITDSLVEGTNVVSAYLNSYGDIHWGEADAQIYSNPVSDPENSSYVEVSYTLENPIFRYGEIDITKEKLFGGSASNPKDFTFTISSNEGNIIESFTHIAQGFSSMIKVYAWSDGLQENLVFTSPSVRVVPENIYIYPSLLDVGENHIELVDVQPSGSVSDTNYILPWSSFEYTYLVKGLVGYGDVFNKSQLAIEDAVQRLITQIGTEGISAESVEVDSQSVQGIQWLWGPSLFKVLSWEKK